MTATAAATALVLALGALVAAAQEVPQRPLTIEDCIAFALAHHPSLRVQAALDEAADAQVALAGTTSIPRLDASAELLRATGNVLTGAYFPLPGIPAISGPPSEPQYGGAFGSVVGVSAGWNAFSLLQQTSALDVALADRRRAGAATDARRLAVAYAAADAFLDLATRTETVRSAKASLERAQVLADHLQPLVAQGLRPGAELARARADIALAATLVARAQEAEGLSEAELARALGLPGARVRIDAAPVLALPATAAPLASERTHPALVERAAATETARARIHLAELAYLPRLDLVAALWVRGSGLPSQASQGTALGLVPDTLNWAAGAVVSWPLLESYAIRERVRVTQAETKAAAARAEEVTQELASQLDRARRVLDGARQVAALTPVALQAARESEQQARARFQAGLTNIVEVAEAQRILAQAEIEDATSRLAVRRAQLLLARAIGDLEPFLAELQRAAPEGK